MEENKTITKILIAEDDDMLAEIYKKKFEEGGYELIMVKDGKEAVTEVKRTKPNLVLLDLVMPEMNGFEALKAIKSDPQTKDVKVVITSNLSQEKERKEALELGATDFLVKSSYELGELAEKIKSYL